MITESSIQKQIRGLLDRLPGVTIWRNNNGAMKGSTWVRFGLQNDLHKKGSSDLIGIAVMKTSLGPIGRFFAIEVKRPGEKPTKEQVLFINHVNNLGGYAVVCSSVQEAMVALQLAQRGEKAERLEVPSPTKPKKKRSANEIKRRK